MGEKVLNGKDLVVKKRVFNDSKGNMIELVGLIDNGSCGRYHQRGLICRDCMLNCEHYLKINGKLQNRTYTQLEVLILQETNKEMIERLKRYQIEQLKMKL